MNLIEYTIFFILDSVIHHFMIIWEIKFNPNLFRDIELFDFEKEMILKERSKDKK